MHDMKSMNRLSKCSALMDWSEKQYTEMSPLLLRGPEAEMGGNKVRKREIT